jgi:hypothetical protein
MRRNGRSRCGLEVALRHIEDARRLSEELGGTDSDVKVYFFQLDGKELRAVLDEYGLKYGKGKKEYAEEILPLWRSGSRKMSGLVAERLFNLLPPRMPLSTKYDMVRTLWEQNSPMSHASFVVGPDCDPNVATREIEGHLLEVVTKYKIHDPLEKRFRWLSSGDVSIRQELLNHFLHEERRLIESDVRTRIPVLLDHLRHAGCWTDRITQEYMIGKHKIDLFFEPRERGIRKGSPGITAPIHLAQGNSPSKQGSGCLMIMAAALTAGLSLSILLLGVLE